VDDLRELDIDPVRLMVAAHELALRTQARQLVRRHWSTIARLAHRGSLPIDVLPAAAPG
jgi:hypothetical protein